jgi:hypothetical protein
MRTRLAISVFILVLVAVYQRAHAASSGAGRLPKVYGICSKDGSKTVYTSEVNDPAVECVVVDGKRIADLGSLGISFSLIKAFQVLISLLAFLLKADVRSKWGEKDMTGPTIRSPWSVRKTGLPIYWLPKGAALTPVSSSYVRSAGDAGC